MSAREKASRWNDRYARSTDPVVPRAEPELWRHRSLLPAAGLALELAAGKGANALFLAEQGLHTLALDFSFSGLRRARAAALHHHLPLHPAVVDLEKISLPATRFSVVSVVRYLFRPLFPALVRTLAPGGILFYKTFNRSHQIAHPGFNPCFLVEPGELVTAFGGLEVIAAGDGQGADGDTSSFIIARKPPASTACDDDS